ncbi:helix-turn-helix transcriptional regulator [bacterium]|nr:helix-turn-helix transcriptional regulator [bacterium]
MARPRRQSNFQGARLRQARRERGWSQAELADNLQVHRGTLIRWESNLSAPTPDQEQSLAQIFGRPREWFHNEPPAARESLLPVEDALSLEEKVDVLLRRVGRIERRLEQVMAMLEKSGLNRRP